MKRRISEIDNAHVGPNKKPRLNNKCRCCQIFCPSKNNKCSSCNNIEWLWTCVAEKLELQLSDRVRNLIMVYHNSYTSLFSSSKILEKLQKQAVYDLLPLLEDQTEKQYMLRQYVPDRHPAFILFFSDKNKIFLTADMALDIIETARNGEKINKRWSTMAFALLCRVVDLYEVFGGEAGVSFDKWKEYFFVERLGPHDGQICYKWEFGVSVEIGSTIFLNKNHNIKHVFYHCDQISNKLIDALEDIKTYGSYGDVIGHRMLVVAPYLITRAGGPVAEPIPGATNNSFSPFQEVSYRIPFSDDFEEGTFI